MADAAKEVLLRTLKAICDESGLYRSVTIGDNWTAHVVFQEGSTVDVRVFVDEVGLLSYESSEIPEALVSITDPLFDHIDQTYTAAFPGRQVPDFPPPQTGPRGAKRKL